VGGASALKPNESAVRSA